MPVARAFRSRGWIQVDSIDQAHIIYTYSNHADWAADLEKWQRFNYIPGYEKWNNKYDFVKYYQQWLKKKKFESSTQNNKDVNNHGNIPPAAFVPETYMLTDNKDDILNFQRVLTKHGGRNFPWVKKVANVNQGKVSVMIHGSFSVEILCMVTSLLESIRCH
jgi:hypothetical protein